MERPILVTVTAWIIIAFALESLVGLPFWFMEALAKGPVHSPVILFLGACAIVFLNIALAIFMLRGAAWARIVYVWATGLIAFAGLSGLARESAQPISLVAINVAKFALITFLLFRKDANVFFSKRPSSA
jgi:hypothetical protein